MGQNNRTKAATPEKRAVIEIHLPMERKTAYVRAARRRNQKLKEWILDHLDRAAMGENEILRSELLSSYEIGISLMKELESMKMKNNLPDCAREDGE